MLQVAYTWLLVRISSSPGEIHRRQEIFSLISNMIDENMPELIVNLKSLSPKMKFLLTFLFEINIFLSLLLCLFLL